MSTFNPGDGWREWTGEEPLPTERWIYQDGGAGRMWVREAPVPPLPDTPYTVIRASFKAIPDQDMVLTPEMVWRTLGSATAHDRTWNMGAITGFMVLAEPRKVTADALADWLDLEAGSPAERDDWRVRAARTIRREFGAGEGAA